MEIELVVAVDCRHEGAALAVDCGIHPGAGVRQRVVGFRTAEMESEHASTHEVARRAALADEAIAERFSRGAAAAVGAHYIRGAQGRPLAVVLLGIDLDAGFC